MVLEHKIRIRDTTTPNDLDSFFNHVWSYGRSAHIVMDTTQCKRVSLGRVLSMKGVLDKHRPNSRKYIDHSTIIVKSQWVKTLLNIGLSIIRTERPVYIFLCNK